MGSRSFRMVRIDPLAAWLLVGAVCLVTSLAPQPASAQDMGRKWTPVNLALFNPTQILPESWDVMGMRLTALLGVNHSVTGLDIAGVFTRTDGDLTGIQIGGINDVNGTSMAIQVGGFNVTKELFGMQVSGLASRAIDGGGGVQISGIYNNSDALSGLQIGLLNIAGEMKGLQLGLLNFNKNGFLPIFPFFNFGM